MAVEMHNTTLEGVKKIIFDPFVDFRGRYSMLWRKSLYSELFQKSLGHDLEFKEADVSKTVGRGTIKGIHGDDQTWKLVSCDRGSFYLAVVNNDPESAQYRQWTSFTLSEETGVQILVPPKFGNGHQAITDVSNFVYFQTEEYVDAAHQFTIKYDDPRINVWWPIPNPVVSQRDSQSSF